jgi:hypothetical protein
MDDRLGERGLGKSRSSWGKIWLVAADLAPSPGVRVRKKPDHSSSTSFRSGLRADSRSAVGGRLGGSSAWAPAPPDDAVRGLRGDGSGSWIELGSPCLPAQLESGWAPPLLIPAAPVGWPWVGESAQSRPRSYLSFSRGRGLLLDCSGSERSWSRTDCPAPAPPGPGDWPSGGTEDSYVHWTGLWWLEFRVAMMSTGTETHILVGRSPPTQDPSRFYNLYLVIWSPGWIPQCPTDKERSI